MDRELGWMYRGRNFFKPRRALDDVDLFREDEMSRELIVIERANGGGYGA